MSLVKLLIAAAALLLAAAIGYTQGRAPLHVEIAQIKHAAAVEKQAVKEQEIARLQAAQKLGDTLTNRLAKSQQTNAQLTGEINRAINTTTMGSTCLTAPTLRLLNTAPGLHVASLSTPPGIAIAESSATATDTDIARWIADAGLHHEDCRTRLDALITYAEQQP